MLDRRGYPHRSADNPQLLPPVRVFWFANATTSDLSGPYHSARWRHRAATCDCDCQQFLETGASTHEGRSMAIRRGQPRGSRRRTWLRKGSGSGTAGQIRAYCRSWLVKHPSTPNGLTRMSLSWSSGLTLSGTSNISRPVVAVYSAALMDSSKSMLPHILGAGDTTGFIDSYGRSVVIQRGPVAHHSEDFELDAFTAQLNGPFGRPQRIAPTLRNCGLNEGGEIEASIATSSNGRVFYVTCGEGSHQEGSQYLIRYTP